MTRGAVHLIVEEVFERIAKRGEAFDDELGSRSNILSTASAHWLRQTAGSNMPGAEVVPRLFSDNVSHESSSTTSLYLHGDDDKRNKTTERGPRIDWS